MTLQVVMKAAVHPLVQTHVPKGFLNSIEDKKPWSSEEEQMENIEKTVLPKHKAVCLAHEPKNGPTRILATAVWLKL